MLTNPTLRALRSRFQELVRSFDVHPSYKQFATSPTDDGAPHVEYRNGLFAYVVTERGEELMRRETTNPDELLYWLVSDVAREVAQVHELKVRKAGEDSRRVLFSKHVAILEDMCPAWANRKQAEYDAVLANHPFHD